MMVANLVLNDAKQHLLNMFLVSGNKGNPSNTHLIQ